MARPADAPRALGDFAGDAPVWTAWSELLTGRAEAATCRALGEAIRAVRTGERLAEVDARIALGVALPHPVGTRRTAEARGPLRDHAGERPRP
ncbi:hypothetical protein [Streptomyces globisporus]|uniref:hypothetical protein n=1 Tax=Streptomyces globisporus TaxID=1908 RepID=UPI0004C8A1FE|nr:hypothetical protein [Streptomyces globisporus]